MQARLLSVLVSIVFLMIGCASPNIPRELEEAPQQVAAIMDGPTEVAAEETAVELDSMAMAEEKRQNEHLIHDLWWTWKYVMWGQGSSKEWPWAW